MIFSDQTLFGKTLYIFHIQGVMAALESCENEIPAKCKNAPDDTSSTIEKCMKSAEDFRQCCQRGRIPKNKQRTWKIMYWDFL